MVVVSAGASTVEWSTIRDRLCLHFRSFDELNNKPDMKVEDREYVLGTHPEPMNSF